MHHHGSDLYQKHHHAGDLMNNIHSEHAGMPVLEGEKWIITVWVREQPLTLEVNNFKIFSKEVAIYKSLTDSEFELECGPVYDVKTLHIELPANNNPTNEIINNNSKISLGIRLNI
jgi:hypothetical protein